MTQLLLLSLATLWGWETLRGLLPFYIPPRLAPLFVGALSYGATFTSHRYLLAAAVAGGVAILRVFANAGTITPLPLPRRVPRPGPRLHQGKAPPSPAGRRIPRL
jgi:hypothetical protein